LLRFEDTGKLWGMNRYSISLHLVVCALLLSSAVSAQQVSVTVPNLIRYEGTLKDAANAPLASVTTGVTFAVYRQQNGGAPVWLETQSVTTDAAGNYSVLLGSTTAAGLPGDLFSPQEQRWLSVQVQGQAEQPRVLMVSVPYAFKAHDAETLGGRSVSDFVLAQEANASGGASNSNPSGSAPTTNLLPTACGDEPLTNVLGATNFVDNTTNQIVSITQNGTGKALTASGSTSNPIVAVTQNGTGPGLNIIQNNAHGTGAGLNIMQNNAQATGFGLSITQKGTAPGLYSTASQYAIEGYAAGNSGTIGVHGVASGTAAVGVLGEVESGSSMGSVGITGQAHSTGGIGMKGIAYDPSGSSVGISAQVQSPNGTAVVANNTAGGMLLQGIGSSGVTMFTVDGHGDLALGNTTVPGSGNVSALGTLSGDGSGLINIPFSGLNGTLMNSQLSGTYSNQVTLPNSFNSLSGSFSGGFSGSFSGNGSGLNGVLPASGSPNYIQNGTTQQTGASFNIDGSGSANSFSANSFNSSLEYQISGYTVLFAGTGNGTGLGNTFVGVGAGSDTMPTAVGNTFTGYGAGGANTMGTNNTFTGYQAGNAATGSNNVYEGSLAGQNNGTGNNNIYLASAGASGESNTIRIGTQGTMAGQQNITYIAGIYGSTVDTQGIPVYVDNNGLLGTVVSSRRFKEQIDEMGDASSALMKLRPVTFLYKPEYSKGERTLQYGLIAEEVAQVYPELVAYDKDGQPYTVRYQYLAPMLLNEVQKQYRRAEQQSEIIASQQTEIMAQKQEIENLKGQLQGQNAAMRERLTRLEGLIREQTQTLATAQKP
jgi:trimeric autotransporter adhesin